MQVSQRPIRGRDDPGGRYVIYLVSDVSGAVGGLPQKTPPFATGSPAAMAAQAVEAAGHGPAFAVDVGTGFAHVYVRQAAESVATPRSQAIVTGVQQPAVTPAVQTATQPIVQSSSGHRLPPSQPGPMSTGMTGFADPATLAAGALGVWEGLKALFGAVTRFDDWVVMPLNTPPVRVFTKAGQDVGSDVVGVMRINAALPNLDDVHWLAYRRDRSYATIGTGMKGGFVDWVPDIRVPLVAAHMVTDLVYPEGSVPTSGGRSDVDDNLLPGSMPVVVTGERLAFGSLSALLGVPPTMPVTVQVRRCGKGMALGIDGACYPKKLLTAATMMNKSKKAPVSYRDAKNITKARTARRKIERYAQRMEEEEQEHEIVHHRRRRKSHTHSVKHRED